MDANDAFNANSEVLSQEDVERLLAQVAEQETTTEIIKPEGQRSKYVADDVQPYDFRQPVFLAAGELRKLRLRQEEFTRSLAARMSIYLRLEFGLQMARLQTLTYQKFLDSLQNPTHLTLFKAEPLQGLCIVEISTQLGITIVDRLLGGPAHAVNLERDLSEIEAALLDQAVQIILTEWCNQWANLLELRPVTVGHESSGRFLQTASHDTVMLVLAMEARLGECQDALQMAFPCYTLEPLMRKLNTNLENTHSSSSPRAASVKWNNRLDDVRIPISAHSPSIELSARQLARIRVGDVIPLDADFAKNIQINLAQMPKFLANLGTQENKWAVELTKVLKT